MACREWKVEASIRYSFPDSLSPGERALEYIKPPARFTINNVCKALGAAVEPILYCMFTGRKWGEFRGEFRRIEKRHLGREGETLGRGEGGVPPGV
jgi:hypothetical protein